MNIINTGTISISNSYIIPNCSSLTYDYTCGGTGLLYVNKRKGVVRYTATDKTTTYLGGEYPIFVSDKGRSFIFQVSRTGVEYKKYIK